MRNFLSSIFLVLILVHSAIGQSGTSTLIAGGKLTEGQRLYSPNKTHYMVMQPDGNLCIYTSNDKFVWCSMATKGSGSYLTMQADGNLVVNDRNNQAVWASETQAYFDPKYRTGEWKPVRAALEDDGTLGLYTAANRKVWSSATGKINTGSAVAAVPEAKPVEGYTGPTVKRQLNIVLPRASEPQSIEVEIADGKVIYQSDMILGDVEDFTSTNSPTNRTPANRAPSNDDPSNDDQSRRWPNSTIPYVIHSRHGEKDIILAGIKEIQDKTNLCVVPRTNQKDYVEFVARNGNWATLGRVGGRQEISIDKAGVGTVVHEILHAAGFYHAQSREDRDGYVTINFGNIMAGKEHNFKKQGKESNIGAYDFGSVMHYPAKAFSKNNRNTIDVKNSQGNESASMGQRNGLSAGDIAAVATLYPPGSCKPNGTGLISSTSEKLPETSTGTTDPAVATTNPTPTRPTSTETNLPTRTRPTGTETNPPARTRPTGTETNPPVVRTRPTGTETNPPVRTRPTGTEAATLKYQPRMKPGDRLIEGEKMVSANGQYQLRGTPDGNFVIEEVRTGRTVYTFPLSNPFGERPAKSYLSYNPDGNICIQSTQNKSYCATTGRDKVAPVILNKSIYAELTDNGRLVLVDKEGREIWATAPGSPTNTGGALTNLALGKPARQSSDIDAIGIAAKAVDGNTDGMLKFDASNSVSHTRDEYSPWWEVDLGAVYSIDRVVIWNRQDDGMEHISHGIITISERPIRVRTSGGSTHNTVTGTVTQQSGVTSYPLSDPRTNSILIGAWPVGSASKSIPTPGRKGRFIRITTNPAHEGVSETPRPLTLAEVQVFGK